MKRRPLLLVCCVIGSFAAMSVYAVWLLVPIEQQMHREVSEEQLWAATQAEREALKLLTMLPDEPQSCSEACKLQFEVLYSRVKLISDFPQVSHFDRMGMGLQIDEVSQIVASMDASLSSLGRTGDVRAFAALAQELSDALRPIAVSTNLIERAGRFESRASQTRAFRILGAGIFGVLVAGLAMAVLLLSHARRLAASETRLRAHSDKLEATVVERTQQLTDALEAERRATEIYRSFMMTVSHQFRSPVAIIHMIAQRQSRLDETRLSPLLRKKFATILEASVRLERLMGSFLNAAKLESGEQDVDQIEFDFNDLVERATSMIQDDYPHRVIECDLNMLPILVRGDPVLLEQVIVNVVGNAVKYSDPPHSVHVEVSRHDDEAVCRVTDQGIGIPYNAINSIFDKLYRASNAHVYPGVGIGLSLSRDIVEMHGGRISFASVEGQGSTFQVNIPRDLEVKP